MKNDVIYVYISAHLVSELRHAQEYLEVNYGILLHDAACQTRLIKSVISSLLICCWLRFYTERRTGLKCSGVESKS